MKGQSEVELLQHYRRDRRELLRFILSAGVIKKVVMQPGMVSLDDVDFDQVSVDHVLSCAKNGGVLDLSEAIKKYYDDMNFPLMTASHLGNVYFLVSNPALSGPPPLRAPPSIAVNTPTPSATRIPKACSLHCTPSHQLSVDDEIESFEDDEEDDQSRGEYVSKRRLKDVNDLELALPPFKSGLSNDDLRETAYEILLASVGAARGLVLPTKEQKERKKSKLMRKLTGSKGEKYKPQPQRAPGLPGILNTMRVQMEISEAMDRRTREGLLSASAGRVSKRMDTLLIPLELLCNISQSQFSDKRSYLRWQKRQLSILEEGLLNHSAVGFETSGRIAAEFRDLLGKIEEAERIPSTVGPAQREEFLRSLRGVALQLAGKPRIDEPDEACHWADGYHLNVQLYEKLLYSVFDMLDEGKLLEEVEEILELLKSTWRILGITQIIHDMCYSLVLFRQFVLTGESSLLQHATQQLKKLALEEQHTPRERIYMKSLRSSVESGNGCRELTFVQSVLSPIKTWCDNRLRDYHLQFSEGTSSIGGIVTAAILAGKLVADELDLTQVVRVSSTAEMAATAKQIEDYIISSIKAAYERALEDVHARSEEEHEHPLMILAENVKGIAKRDSTIFSPVLSRWNARSNAISASLLHSLYGKQLKPFLEGVSHLTEDVTSVLPAADILEQYLIELIYSVYEEDGVNGCYKQDICLYQIEAIASPLIARWVNIQLGRILEWVERAIQQERWEPLSSQQRHGVSIVEIYRIIEETVDQFFNFNLPMRLPQLKSLLTGFDNALQVYSESIINQLVDKGDLIPPTPILTRYKRDTAVKAFTKKKVMDPGSLAEWNSGQINMLSTSKLCVRLNSFYYMVNQLSILEDTIRERWIQLRPSRNSIGGDVKSKHVISNKQVDGFSSSFDGTKKLANEAVDKICDFTGMKIIFWDMRESFLNGLYKGSVSQARMDTIIPSLDSVLGQLCDAIVEPLRDQVVIGLLQASLDGFVRILLDGGPSRVFSQDDSRMLTTDLQVLKDFFIAGGDGLPHEIVDNALAPVQRIVKLYSLETNTVIDSLRHASAQTATCSNSERYGSKSANDADTLLRVLCHRSDREASKFLKKQYKLPKSTGYEDGPGKEPPLSPFTGASVTDILKRSSSFHWAADGQRSFRLLKQKIQEATMEFKQGGW